MLPLDGGASFGDRLSTIFAVALALMLFDVVVAYMALLLLLLLLSVASAALLKPRRAAVSTIKLRSTGLPNAFRLKSVRSRTRFAALGSRSPPIRDRLRDKSSSSSYIPGNVIPLSFLGV